jgi:hypothetical protein
MKFYYRNKIIETQQDSPHEFSFTVRDKNGVALSAGVTANELELKTLAVEAAKKLK